MLALILACAYQPPLAPSDDYPETVSLSGQVVLTSGSADGLETFDTGDSTIERRVGHVVIYAADDLPPPSGFGSPLDLATLPSSAWSVGSGSGLEGVVSAEWSISGLPTGRYVVSALIDNDGDFNPFPQLSDFAGGATCGDQLGAYLVDAESGTPLPLDVQAPEHIEGLSILVSEPLTTERPAFVLDTIGTDGTLPHQDLAKKFSPTGLADLPNFELTLAATGVVHPKLSLNHPGAVDCPTLFTVMTVDADGDGVADPHPVEAAASVGAPAMWPRVLFRLLLDEEGNPVEETWLSEGVIDFRPNEAVGSVPGREQALAEDWVLPALMTPNLPIGTSELPVLWTGQAAQLTDEGLGEVLTGGDIPGGTWGVIVMNHTGQSWVMPNQLSSEELWGADALDAQGAAVLVQ
jgi:hypothetical protein